MYSGDIALNKTDSNIVISNAVVFIRLPQKDSEPVSRDVILSGWGVSIATSREPTRYLQTTNSTILSEHYCWIYDNFRKIGVNNWELGSKICVSYSQSTACFLIFSKV